MVRSKEEILERIHDLKGKGADHISPRDKRMAIFQLHWALGMSDIEAGNQQFKESKN